jgi:hypothetical protein|tara:strand:+ start:651 stop:953 length:303 start_codon:yes stop_codon:yes gene_type:complete
MGRNYIIKPKKQDSAEFRVYVRNLIHEVGKHMDDFQSTREDFFHMSNEIATMPKKGACDIYMMANELSDLSEELDSLHEKTLEVWDKLREWNPNWQGEEE